MRMRALAVTAAFLLAACAAIRAQKQQQVRADASEFTNLQMLPSNIKHDELIATMRGFARALGTRCDHCHVENPPGSKEKFNYASDAKKEKNIARTMLRMTRSINTDFLPRVDPKGQKVACITCHLGHTEPPPPPPPPPQSESPSPPKS
jgi:Photosynthetic reaction centre cytochrome C subunit